MNRSENSNGNPSMVMTAILGGAIGAATAIFFSDKQRRLAVKDFIANIKDRKEDFEDEVGDKVQRVSNEVKRAAKGWGEKIEREKVDQS